MRGLFVVALAFAGLALLHCGSFGEDGVAPSDGGASGGDGFCSAESLKAATFIACDDFDSAPTNFSILSPFGEAMTNMVASPIGVQPQALQIEATNTDAGQAHAGIVASINAPAIGETIRLRFRMQPTVLDDLTSGSDALVTVASISLGTDLATVILEAPDSPGGIFGLRINEIAVDPPKQEVNKPYEIWLDVARTADLTAAATVWIDTVKKGTKTELVVSPAKWAVSVGLGVLEGRDHGQVIIDDVLVERLQ